MRRPSRALWFAELGPRGVRVRGVAVGVVVAMGASGVAGTAWGAFEVRDASPAALGAVSMDLDVEAMGDAGALEGRGLQFGASHAAFYQAEGLAADQVWLGVGGRRASACVSGTQVGFPGARETRVRVAVQEGGGRRIALAMEIERLELALEGEPSLGGWAVGGGTRALIEFPHLDLEIAIAADRLFRLGDLERLNVGPSVPLSIRLRSGPASAAWVDRWEADGRRSPRVVLDFVLAGSASVRLGRGEKPDRIGLAIAIRWRRVEVSAGRLDPVSGGVVSAVSLSLLPPLASGGH